MVEGLTSSYTVVDDKTEYGAAGNTPTMPPHSDIASTLNVVVFFSLNKVTGERFE